MYFPSREEGLEAVISLVEPWLAKGPDHIISFICSAKYNYEFVFVELFKKFHQKVIFLFLLLFLTQRTLPFNVYISRNMSE